MLIWKDNLVGPNCFEGRLEEFRAKVFPIIDTPNLTRKISQFHTLLDLRAMLIYIQHDNRVSQNKYGILIGYIVGEGMILLREGGHNSLDKRRLARKTETLQ
ncbi:hypothetical protein RRF57_000225 [Xylaria bambusicola]|uniref:Uncharacterized protein n=1 Tax=Xylaria bambusicola TaxID=326684 RepID=A0AAN7UE73_9PEZI